MKGFYTLLLIGIVILFAVLCIKASKQPRAKVTGYTRCPTCGAKVPIRGNTWECGYCCDSGTVRKKQ